MAAIVVLLLLSASLLVSGCTSSTNSNQAASSASQAASTTAKATASASASASATPTPKLSVTPSPTPSPQPTPQPVTGSFGQSTYIVANGTVITATVSNWRSNPDVALGLSTNHAPVPMQPIGNGVYSYTLEGVVILVHGTGRGGISLYDNGVIVAYANTTWTNP